jgi:hypothetical protein
MKRLFVAAVLSLAVILIVGAVALSSSARGDASPSPGRQTVAAPIDHVQVVIRESNPPQVTLDVKAGLPSGCAVRGSHSVSRAGDTITVSVLNTMPTGDPICTMIYGTYELNIDLGSDFRPGATYTVRVNDKTTTFKT